MFVDELALSEQADRVEFGDVPGDIQYTFPVLPEILKPLDLIDTRPLFSIPVIIIST